MTNVAVAIAALLLPVPVATLLLGYGSLKALLVYFVAFYAVFGSIVLLAARGTQGQ